MGFLRNLNIRRHTKTLRTLDFENIPPGVGRERDPDEDDRVTKLLYENVSRAPREGSGERSGAAHHPVPGERPHPRAQWDDVRAEWVVWDSQVAEWVPWQRAAAEGDAVAAREGDAPERPDEQTEG